MATMTIPDLESLTFKIEQEIRVKASLEVTFNALIEQLGPALKRTTARPCHSSLKLGRAAAGIRDLGDGNGHCWATVQAIKRPTLLEFSGPLMMSYPVANNVQYRLSEQDGETLIKFCHAALETFPRTTRRA